MRSSLPSTTRSGHTRFSEPPKPWTQDGVRPLTPSAFSEGPWVHTRSLRIRTLPEWVKFLPFYSDVHQSLNGPLSPSDTVLPPTRVPDPAEGTVYGDRRVDGRESPTPNKTGTSESIYSYKTHPQTVTTLHRPSPTYSSFPETL